jgi:hypothetical protein
MNRDIISGDNWDDRFDQIAQKLTKLRSILEGAIIPRMPTVSLDDLVALEQELRTVEQAWEDLRCYVGRNPREKYLSGQQLTREEFYLLAVQGILIIPSETGLEEAYKEFDHYRYEDNEWMGYINPAEPPDPPSVPGRNGGWTQKVHIKVGILPEQVRIKFLREDQLKFFRKFKPKLFSRFRKD